MKQLFRINKLMYCIKNLVFYAFLVGLGVLIGTGIIKVKAADDFILDLDSLYNSFNEREVLSNKNLQESLDELSSVLKENNMNYVISFANARTTSSIFDTDLIVYSENSIDVSLNYFSGNIARLMFPTANKVSHFYLTTSNNIKENYENFIEYIRENKSLPTATFEKWNYSTSIPDAFIYYDNLGISNQQFILYDTNMKLKLSSIASKYSGLKIGDNIYRKNEFLLSYKSIYDKNIYDVNQIDHIEVEFDLNKIPSSALIPGNEDYFKFEMTYDIKITDDQQATILSSKTLDIPSMEYVRGQADGTQIYTKYALGDIRRNQYNQYYGKDSYTNQYYTNYDYDRSLKLIINCRDIDDVYLSLNLSSTLNYKITVFYRENVEDYRQYYETVDITNKYAALFIPKLRLNDSQNTVSSYFISSGKFQVEERDTYTDNFTLYKDPVVVQGNNQYYYFYTVYFDLHYNDSFYYKNLNYPNSDTATIQYDTRYFIVSVCKNEFECETVINPNTGEVITPKPPHDKDEWSFSKLIERVKTFVNNLHSNLDPIAQSIQYFYNKLPGYIQNFLIVIYVTMLLFATIRVLRRK